MERRPDRFTAFIDANVLIDVLRRNLILSLAEAGAFRARWSARVLDEFEANLPKVSGNMTPEKARKQSEAIMRAFPEGEVVGYASLESAFADAPDKDDIHVMAAAQRCGAAVIVTDNLKDFPPAMLAPLDMEAVGADDFIADAIALEEFRAVVTVKNLRARLRRPPLSAADLIAAMRKRALHQTADLLEPYLEHL